MSCQDGGRGWKDAFTSEGISGVARSWERQEGSFPRASKGAQPFPVLDFQLLASIACERINVCCFKPPSCGNLLQPPKEANTGQIPKVCKEQLKLIKKKIDKPNRKMDREGFQTAMNTKKVLTLISPEGDQLEPA